MLIIFWLSLIILFYIFMGYPIVLNLLEKYFGKTVVRYKDGEELPSVSLFIPAYNEDKVIREKIENSLRLNYPEEKLSIVIASDGSTDSTNAIINQFKDAVTPMIYKKRCGKTQLINKVMPELSGEIVVFSDASSMLKTDSILKMVRNYRDEKIGGVSGTYKLQNNDNSDRSKGEGLYWKYETFLKRKESNLHSILGGHGSLYSIRRHLFEPLAENTINDDYIIPMRLLKKGYRVVYEPQSISYERTSTDVKGEMNRRSRISFGNFQQIVILRSLLNPTNGFISFEFISHKLLRSFSFFFMITLFISSLLINSEFMKLFVLLELIFYLIGLAGFILSSKKIKSKITAIPFYLCMINLSSLVGFIKFIFNKQKVTWEKA